MPRSGSPRPIRSMNRAAAAKVAASFVARKQAKETKAKLGMPVWREEDGKKISLVITRAGRDAIGVSKAEECRSPRTYQSPMGRFRLYRISRGGIS